MSKRFTYWNSFAAYTARTIAYMTAIAVPNDATVYYASTAYEITGAEMWTLVNDFDRGIIADGLDTRCLAIYPMIGGTATSCKYNFLNPADTDAALRLGFSGGWAFSGSGGKPDGTTAYARTHFIPSAHLTTSTLAHLSFYSQDNTSAGGSAQYNMGSFDDFGLLGLICLRAAGSTRRAFIADFPSGISFRSAVDGTASTNGNGMYVGTQQGANAKLIRNGTTVVQNTTAIDPARPPSTLEMHIGGLNRNGSLSNFLSAKGTSFNSIGYSLDDTQAANLAARVNTLQTGLHRNTY